MINLSSMEQDGLDRFGMSKCKIVMVTSCKGGVGKSTVSANLGLALAKLGKRVLLCDCDYNIHCLDLIMGMQDSIVFNASDVATGRTNLGNAIVKYPGQEGLYLLAAPEDGGAEIDLAAFENIVNAGKELLAPDYVILDTPGDLGKSFRFAAAVSSQALVITTNQPTAIRAAEKTAAELYERGVDPRLIINYFDLSDLRSYSKEERSGIVEIIDQTYTRLIGVIPFRYQLGRAQEKGCLYDSLRGDIVAAFENIARRMTGEEVPLFTGFPERRKIKRII